MSDERTIDLAALKLSAGEARRIDAEVTLEDVLFGDEHYVVTPRPVPVSIAATKMIGGGWSLRADFSAAVTGPCMRCLQDAAPSFSVTAREVDVPDQDPPAPELDSPYVDTDQLDLAGWARDALVLELPAQILCRPDCRGLCPVCGADLNADPDHAHEQAPDSRWAKLSELKFDE